jgi:hypothetical protein
MAFWNNAALDPKRQFKFKVTFGLLDGSSTKSYFIAQSADRPVYTISDGTKVEFLDKSFHFPGKISWNPVKIKFVDAVVGDAGDGYDPGMNVSQKVYTYLIQSGWVDPIVTGTSNGNFATINKNKSVAAAKGNLQTGASPVTIQVLNANGVAVDEWTLNNAFITNVALNNLDYAAEGILTAEFTFRYDWATYA